MSALRARRERYKRFTYGRQWDDPVTDPLTGQTLTERALISKDGRTPLTNNLIRQMVKNIVGRFRAEHSLETQLTAGDDEAARNMRRRLGRIYAENELEELDARLLEEFLISGIAIQRVASGNHERDRGLPKVVNVNPTRCFMHIPLDPRGTDLRLIGMLHDLTPEEVIGRWSNGDLRFDKRLLDRARLLASSTAHLSSPALSSPEFALAPEGMVRVVEIWTRSTVRFVRSHDPSKAVMRIEAEEAASSDEPAVSGLRRSEYADRWSVGWYLSDGTLLSRHDCPPSESHPFFLRLYPLVDGEIHSLVEDVVDQQKYVNRLVNLIDRMMATAAKGALLFPVDALPEGASFHDIARQWAATDGIVLYKGFGTDPPPRQLQTNVGDIGAKDLLKVQMQLFQDISGVGDSLAGRNLPANIGADRYNLQIENASMSIRDLLSTFGSMLDARDLCLLKSYKP